MRDLSKYIGFAVLTTALNLGLQYLTFQIYQGPFSLYLAMFIGTGAGLVTKYVLDKFFVFNQPTGSVSEESGAFLKYAGLGALTTLLAWGVEWGFDHYWTDPSAKYIGGLVGLGLGYVTKFFLDKKFVFQTINTATHGQDLDP